MIPPESEIAIATRLVVETLESLGVPYLVGGSVASSIHGISRSTRDVDLVAALKPEDGAPLVDRLGSAFYADLPSIIEEITARRSFNVIHLETMVKIDLFVAKETPFTASQFERRTEQAIGDQKPLKLSVASPEDTILSKLDWYRLGGEISDRQWNDILGVLKVQGDRLDFDYLRQWAGELGVADLLEKVRGEAGP